MSLLRNSAIYTLGGFLPKVVSFLLLPVVTRYLALEDYGIVTALLAVTAFVGIFASLQLPGSGMFRCYFDYAHEADRRRFVGTIVGAVLVVNLLVTGLCFAARPLLQLLYPSISFYPYYTIALLTVPLSSLVDVFQILFRLKEKPLPFVFISSLAFLLNIGFLLWFVVGLRGGAEGMLWAGLAGQAATIPVALWIARHEFHWSWSTPMFRNALSYSLQSIPYMLSGILMTNVDRYLVNRLSSTYELGLYGSAWRLASVFNLLIGAVAMSYDPFFMRTACDPDQKAARMILGATGTRIILGFCFLGFAGILFAGAVVHLMMAPQYYAVAAVLPFMIAGMVVGVGDYVGSMGAKFAKKQIWFTPVYLAATLLNALLDWLLVPQWGAVGAAVAGMLCAGATMLLRFACSQRFWPVPLDFRSIFAAGSLCLFAGLAVWWIPGLWGWFARAAACIAGGLYIFHRMDGWPLVSRLCQMLGFPSFFWRINKDRKTG